MHMSEYITINDLKFLLLFGLKFLAKLILKQSVSTYKCQMLANTEFNL